MANKGVRQGHVAVLTSWMRDERHTDERHTSAPGSLLTLCVRNEAGAEG